MNAPYNPDYLLTIIPPHFALRFAHRSSSTTTTTGGNSSTSPKDSAPTPITTASAPADKVDEEEDEYDELLHGNEQEDSFAQDYPPSHYPNKPPKTSTKIPSLLAKLNSATLTRQGE